MGLIASRLRLAVKNFYLHNLPGPSGKDHSFLEKLQNITSQEVVDVPRRDWTFRLYKAIEESIKSHFVRFGVGSIRKHLQMMLFLRMILNA